MMPSTTPPTAREIRDTTDTPHGSGLRDLTHLRDHYPWSPGRASPYGASMGLGDSLKKWAQSKATELLTADGDTRSDAAASADVAKSRARADAGESLVRAAFPKLGEMADRAEASRVA